jgi:hypothetical protein
MLPIPLRFSVVIARVLALAAATTAMLNVLKFEQIIEGFEQSRYSFVARDIEGALEQNLNLGLPLDQIENAQELIERQLGLDSDLTSIAIFDPDGAILYQISRLPEGSAQALLGDGAKASGIRDERFVSSPIANDFGQVVGGVIVRYSGSAVARREERVLHTMAIATLSAAIAGGIILWLGASRLLAPLGRRLAETTALLQQARHGHQQAPTDSRFEALAGQALHDLRQVEQDLDGLQTGASEHGDPP